jgi:hypothetical protein
MSVSTVSEGLIFLFVPLIYLPTAAGFYTLAEFCETGENNVLVVEVKNCRAGVEV